MILTLNNCIYFLMEALLIMLTTHAFFENQKDGIPKSVPLIFGTTVIFLIEVYLKTVFFSGYLLALFMFSLFYLALFYEGGFITVVKQELTIVMIIVILRIVRNLTVLFMEAIDSEYKANFNDFTYAVYYIGIVLEIVILGNIIFSSKKYRISLRERVVLTLVALTILPLLIIMVLPQMSCLDYNKMGLLTFIATLVYIAALGGTYRVIRLSGLIKQNNLLREKLVTQQIDVIEAEEDYQLARKVRHDVNRNMTIFRGLLKDKKYDELEIEMNRQIDNMPKDSYVHINGNNKISAVLNEKIRICKRKEIELSLHNTAVANEDMEMDMAIVLSNLIDNAIEAYTEEKDYKISVDLFESNGMYNILVQNSLYTQVKRKDGRFETVKSDKKSHGVGLIIVQDIVDKYYGFIDNEEKNNQFIMHVAVPM